MKTPDPLIFPMTDNLRAAAWRAQDNPRAAVIHFQARSHEEMVSFRIRTTAPIVSHLWESPQIRQGVWLMSSEILSRQEYKVQMDLRFLDHPFIVGLEIETGSDPRDAISEIEVWDGSGAQPTLIYIENEK